MFPHLQTAKLSLQELDCIPKVVAVMRSGCHRLLHMLQLIQTDIKLIDFLSSDSWFPELRSVKACVTVAITSSKSLNPLVHHIQWRIEWSLLFQPICVAL